MNLKLSLIFALFISILNAQITDLSKLSTGKYYDSDEIVDSNNNKRGYFYLFETDKIAKETVTLEYVVLDENLKKVTNGFFTEMKFESFLINSKKIVIDVTYNDNKLLISLQDDFGQPGAVGFLRYRKLDLKTNKLSDVFLYNDNKLQVNPSVSRDFSEMSKNQSDRLFFYNKVGLIGFKTDSDKSTKTETKHTTLFDENFKEVWKSNYSISTKKQNKKNLSYVNSDEKTIVFFNHESNKKDEFINIFSLMFIDSKNGKLINEYAFTDLDKFSYKTVDCTIDDKNITVYGNYSKFKKNWTFNDEENIGLFKMVFSAIDGRLLENKIIKWADNFDKLGADKDGYIKKEGYLFVHNILSLSTGKTIAVCEAFKQEPIITNNIYFLELNADFLLNQVFVAEKFRNKFPRTFASGSTIKLYGLFDFVDYQIMGDDEFLFYFNDNEKNSRNRKKSTLYGVVSYSDGMFKKQILDLKTEISTKLVNPAKKGYVLIKENFDEKDKPSELRLEKINY